MADPISLHLTDEELLALLTDLESDRAERKERLAGDAPTKVREAVCAFANDLPGHETVGVVFVGVDDGGQPVGLDVTDELLLSLSGMRSDGNILPIPTMAVEKRRLLGHEVAVIIVAPADAPPVKYKGRTWIRVGPRRGIASHQDERILNERRRFRDLAFDLQPIPSATLVDLSKRLFEEEYLPAAFARDVLEANNRSYEERLLSTRMLAVLAEPTPTLVGVLALSPRARDFVPGAFVQFLRIEGAELGGPIIDEEVVDGPLAQLIRRLDEKLRAHIRTSVDLTSAAVESRAPDYPVTALEQLVRNAVMHRTYEGTNAPVRVTWFDDRVEIQSPGGPYGLVTKESFGKPGVTDYRNPTLAEAMKTLGFVQRFGVGIATANRALAANGNPPIAWQIDDRYVLAVVRRKQ